MTPTLRRFRIRPGVITNVITSTTRHPGNKGHRVKALTRLVRCEIKARVTNRPVITPIGDHSSIYAYLHRGGSWRAVKANPPDFAEMNVWRSRISEDDLFVDVGAHVGIYSLWALDLGAQVLAVEPDPENVLQLRANLLLNDYSAEVFAGALGKEGGTMRLAGPDLLRRHLTTDGEGVEVEVKTLDELLGDRRAAGVKIDVEGAERLVLEGASRALVDLRVDLLQIEWNHCSLDLLGEDRRPVAELLRKCGYELCRPDASGALVPEEDLSATLLTRDMFARPITR